LSLEGFFMTELPEHDQFFLNVGKCLSTWNRVEASILQILEYGCSRRGALGHEFRIGYWAVVSFEARLKWCNAVVTHRLQGKKYEALAERWNALNNKAIKKARKRAEVAHGSVVTMVMGSDTQNKKVRFIPYMNREIDHLTAKLPLSPQATYDDLQHLRLKEIIERTGSFHRCLPTSANSWSIG
jgi:hypothetical protein